MKNRRSKYGNTIAFLGNIKFHSKAEMHFYSELLLREKAGEVSDIKLQPKFIIEIKEKKICSVILDFSFFDKKLNEVVYIDVKGKDNALSILKRKLVEACLGIKIQVIY